MLVPSALLGLFSGGDLHSGHCTPEDQVLPPWGSGELWALIHAALGPGSSVDPIGHLQPCCLPHWMLPRGGPGQGACRPRGLDGDTRHRHLPLLQARRGRAPGDGRRRARVPTSSPGRVKSAMCWGRGLQAPPEGEVAQSQPVCPEWAALSQALRTGPRPACLGGRGGGPQPLGSRPTSWPLPAQAPHSPGGKGNEVPLRV